MAALPAAVAAWALCAVVESLLPLPLGALLLSLLLLLSLHSNRPHASQPQPQLLAQPSAACACTSSGPDAVPAGGCCAAPAPAPAPPPSTLSVRILFASEGGRARAAAWALAATLRQSSDSLVVAPPLDCASADPEEALSSPGADAVVLVVSTHSGGGGDDATPQPPAGAGPWPPRAAHFLSWLAAAASDERVGPGWLARAGAGSGGPLAFAVLGLGDSAYGPALFNAAAAAAHAALAAVGGAPLCAPGACDDQDAGAAGAARAWADALAASLLRRGGGGGGGGAASEWAGGDEAGGWKGGEGDGAGDETEEEDEEDERGGDDEAAAAAGSESDADMEDIAGAAARRRRRGGGGGAAGPAPAGPREMVTPTVRASLTKQGYRVIGSHSGVKVCRWTKSMLRGRGGCYKHAFYGIDSHRCMEATPSLACANKCVFCWRHHSNPVGTSWKWATDEPAVILDGALAAHGAMIRQMRGVPGVTPGRLQEGLAPRHCALSLVGEPIMYPHINALVGMLHARRISTFLVTNAQFPDAIAALAPVTQLYVSVDAATPATLKAVDRPLFSDYWERFTRSLALLRTKRQRTVYRLTLVAGWNITDAGGYAALVALGEPDLIEIKGVTYCGAGAGKDALTMANVPRHADVVAFAESLATAVSSATAPAPAPAGGYGLACEHAHSCCVVLARRDRYWREGRWWTHIDYDRFQDLAASGRADFCAADYAAPTPGWAVAGAPEAGFSPAQERFRKERRHGGGGGAAGADE